MLCYPVCITSWTRLRCGRLILAGRESSIHPQICRSLARVSVGDEVMCEREILVQCIARWKSRSIANERTATASEDAKDEFVVVLNRSEGQVKI